MSENTSGQWPGIMQFYSSQAQVMLAQWRNIEHLLGETSDYTGPGTHCEVLLRDFLRRCVPAKLAVDKGFIFGRVAFGGGNRHSPEIDILIHDITEYRPVFRLEDFVIVQPEAVRGLIQVKRNLHNSLDKGVDNVVAGKRHVLEGLRQKGWRSDEISQFEVFSAVFGFDDEPKTGGPIQQQLQAACDAHADAGSFEVGRSNIWMLPDFVGSLSGIHVIARPSSYSNQRQYAVLSSRHGEENVSLQALVWWLTKRLWPHGRFRQPFEFPILDQVKEFFIRTSDDDVQ